MIDIQLNNQHLSVPEGYLLSQLLDENISKEPKGMAVAVNERVIIKTEWNSHPLKAGDRILIIKASQGG